MSFVRRQHDDDWKKRPYTRPPNISYLDMIKEGYPFQNEPTRLITSEEDYVFSQMRLNSPVTDIKAKHFIHREFYDKFEESLYEYSSRTSEYYSTEYQKLFVQLWHNSEDHVFLQSKAEDLVTCVKASIRMSDLQCEAVFGTPLIKAPTEYRDVAVGYLNRTNIWNFTNRFLDISLLMSHLQSRKNVTRLCNHKSISKVEKHIYVVPFTENLKAYCTSEICLIRLPSDGITYVLEKEMIQAITDGFLQRMNAILTSFISCATTTPNYLSVAQLKFLFTWGDTHLMESVENAYGSIKLLEPLVTSVMHRISGDIICDPLIFHNKVLQELTENSKKCGPASHEASNNLLMLLMALSNEPHKLCQIFGLYRVWMHPAVNEVKGAIAIRKIAQKKKVLNMKIVKEISRQFKMLFIQAFYNKHNRWPKLRFDENTYSHNDLYIAYKNNHRPPFSKPGFCRYDLDYVHGEKTFDINPTFDMATLISDKSCSLPKSRVIKSIKERGNQGYGPDRKVVVNWLKSPYTDAKSFLTEIADKGLKDDDKIILVRAKERELKADPRMFCMMTLNARMYFVLTEQLIADHFLPYFKEVTMTDDQVTLMGKIISNTRTTDNNKIRDISSYIICNIDFSKWNLNFRQELTKEIFQFMDELLGYPNGMIGLTHPFFSSCWVSLSSGFLPKLNNTLTDFAENSYTWNNHYGGFEGIRQKGWTLITIAMLDYVCKNIGLSFTIMGQGDNQVLRFHFPELKEPDDNRLEQILSEVKGKIEEFKISLEKTCDDVGLPVKMEETWFSSTFFAYGKFLVYKGVPMSMSIKKLLRQGPYANESYPSLDTSISSIFANGMQSCLSDSTVAVPHIMSIFHSTWAFISHYRYSLVCQGRIRGKIRNYLHFEIPLKSEKTDVYKLNVDDNNFNRLSDPLIDMLNLTPKILGGYPILLITSFLIREFPDPLSESLSVLKKCYAIAGNDIKKYIKRIMEPLYHTECNYQMLVQDVLSVNLVTPTTSGNFIKSKMRNRLPSLGIIGNKYILDLFSVMHDKETEELCELLCKTNPLHPRICNAIYNITPVGYSNKILSKIQNTKTIVGLLSRKIGSDIIDGASAQESAYFESFLYRCLHSNPQLNFDNFLCMSEYAHHLRLDSWKLNDINGITVPHPLEEFIMILCNTKECQHCLSGGKERNYVSYKLAKSHSWIDYLEKNGPYASYLGSSTGSKTYLPLLIKDLDMSQLFTNMLKVISTLNWSVKAESHLGKFIKRLFNACSELPADLFIPEEFQVSGSAAHRFQDEVTDHGGFYNNLYNVYTYISISTDNMEDYKKSTKNTNLHFQSAMLFGQALIAHGLIYQWSDTNLGHYHYICHGIKVLDERQIEGPEELEQVVITEHKENPYLYIGKEVMKGNISRTVGKNFVVKEENIRDIGDYLLATELSLNLCRIRDSYDEIYHRTIHYVNMVFYIKCDPISIIKTVIKMITGNVIRREFFSKSRYISSDLLRESVLRYIDSCLSKDFTELSRFYLYQESREKLQQRCPYYIPIEWHPCPQSVLNTHMKSILYDYVVNEFDALSRIPYIICNHEIIDNFSWRDAYVFNIWKVSCSILTIEDYPAINKVLKDIEELESQFFTTFQKEDQLKYLITGCNMRPEIGNLVVDVYSGWALISKDIACKKNDTIPVVPPSIVRLNLDMCPAEYSLVSLISQSKSLSLPMNLELPDIKSYNNHQIEDPYAMETVRINKWLTAGATKVLSLYPEYAELLSCSMSGYFLGDGEGGISTLFCRFNKNLKVASHTHSSSETITIGIHGNIRPSILEMNGYGENLIKHPLTLEMETDLTDYDSFKKDLGRLGKFTFIVSDIEGNFWLKPEKLVGYLRSLFSVIQSCTPEWVLIKFYHNFDTITKILLAGLRQHYKSVSILRSNFSKMGSAEFYVLGQKFQGLDKSIVTCYMGEYKTTVDIDQPSLQTCVINLRNHILTHNTMDSISQESIDYYNSYFENKVDKIWSRRMLWMLGLKPKFTSLGKETLYKFCDDQIKSLIYKDYEFLSHGSKKDLNKMKALKIAHYSVFMGLYQLISTERVYTGYQVHIEVSHNRGYPDIYVSYELHTRDKNRRNRNVKVSVVTPTKLFGKQLKIKIRLMLLMQGLDEINLQKTP